MLEFWQKNIDDCRASVQANHGPRVVNVVSGSQNDREYWEDRLLKTRQDIFRADGKTLVISTQESTRKGNFLGSLNAWDEVKKALAEQTLPPVTLMNMVFGQGKRLSPFTQALANRKPAFPTPMRSLSQGMYLTTADVASFSSSLWLNHLEANGFRGVIVKWGDEAVIPGKAWTNQAGSYSDADGIRFVWQTEPNEDLAREKEWVEFDADTYEMTYQYTRQGVGSLCKRLLSRGEKRLVGVNLGSLGISYRLMDIARAVFKEDTYNDGKWVDWDPYTWIALSCQEQADWAAEAAFEDQLGVMGMHELEARIPDFYHKINRVRQVFQDHYGRPPIIKVLDFGEPYWMDWGLHLSLRRSLEQLTIDSDIGATTRELFNLPHQRDERGNILVRSSIPEAADIRDSMLVDTLITDPESVIHSGLVVGGRHRKIWMPYGGSALFCAADEMKFNGPHAIAFRTVGPQFQLEEGGRLTHLFLSGNTLEMRTNESLVNYEGESYTSPIMGNSISFAEAARRMSGEDTRLVEDRWLSQWSGWF